MMGLKTFEQQIAGGTAKATGDAGILKKIASIMVDFDPRFEILPGTQGRTAELNAANPFKAEIGKPIAE